jgi:hypothetical protein
MDKTLLLATFIFPERLDWFLDFLENKFDISKNKVFVFKNLDDEAKVIVTFKLILKGGKRINLKNHFPNAIPIHKRGTAIYTINALNKLIELETDLELGNIDYKNHKIDWSKYQDSLILTNNNELRFYRIKRVFS